MFLAVFQSTLPVWGATADLAKLYNMSNISIHAPRVGSDVVLSTQSCLATNFNPRSPCGERQVWGVTLHTILLFQSTLPVWGATLETTL